MSNEYKSWIGALGALVCAAKDRDQSRDKQFEDIDSAHGRLFDILRENSTRLPAPVLLAQNGFAPVRDGIADDSFRHEEDSHLLHALASGYEWEPVTYLLVAGHNADTALLGSPFDGDSVEAERKKLRLAQAIAVMPLIGPLMDAFEGMDSDIEYEIRNEAPGLYDALKAIGSAMETAGDYQDLG